MKSLAVLQLFSLWLLLGSANSMSLRISKRQTVTCTETTTSLAGDSCALLAIWYGISVETFQALNPDIEDCNNLPIADYCISGTVSSATTSSTTPITTSTAVAGTTTSSSDVPDNIMPNTIEDCTQYYLVVVGDGCWNIANTYGINLNDFYKWNPSVGTDCSSLWLGYYVCVSVTSGTATTTTTAATATSTTTTSVAPTPLQGGTRNDCSEYYFVHSGDNCWSIWTAFGISESNFFSWNAGLDEDCTNLWSDVYVCVGL